MQKAMIFSFGSLVILYLSPSAGRALEPNCNLIKDAPGIYFLQPGSKPDPIKRVEVLKYDPEAKIYIVPDRTKWRDESVWHVRLSTVSIEAKEKTAVKLRRNGVASNCVQRDRISRRDDWEGDSDLVSYDNYLNRYNRADQYLQTWHFRAGWPRCYNTDDVIEPIVATDGQVLARDFERTSIIGSAQAAVRDLSNAADVTSVMVFKRLSEDTCYSFSIPKAPRKSFFNSQPKWRPKTTTVELWRLPIKTSKTKYTINWVLE
jgi:hypothetical protein